VQQEAEGLNPSQGPARPLFGRQAALAAGLDTVPYCQPAGMLIRYRIITGGRERSMESAATYCGTVYPWQCDHVGHMNIMWYVGKFDEANWNLFARIGLTPTYLRESGHGMVAAQQSITYKRELLAGDIVEVKSVLLEIRDRSIRFRHEMRNAETGEVAAVCEFTGVHMDRQSRQSAAFSDSIRRAAARLLAFPEPADA
jgi:acyl-CoA thioester hydrolase